MRKILNYLLGEDLVNEQSDGGLIEAITGAMAVIVFACLLLFVLWVTGG